jgi:hypothetical protein
MGENKAERDCQDLSGWRDAKFTAPSCFLRSLFCGTAPGREKGSTDGASLAVGCVGAAGAGAGAGAGGGDSQGLRQVTRGTH